MWLFPTAPPLSKPICLNCSNICGIPLFLVLFSLLPDCDFLFGKFFRPAWLCFCSSSELSNWSPPLAPSAENGLCCGRVLTGIRENGSVTPGFLPKFGEAVLGERSRLDFDSFVAFFVVVGSFRGYLFSARRYCSLSTYVSHALRNFKSSDGC